MEKQRETFGSKFGYLCTIIGGCVGMGNLWRFPFYTSSYGGAIFVFIYLAFMVFLGVPCVLAETAIGKRARRDPTHCYMDIYQQERHKPSKLWHVAGFLPLIVPLAVSCYYYVVASWTLRYFVLSFTTPLQNLDLAYFKQINQDPVSSIIYLGVFVIIVGAIVGVGLQQGVERISKIMVPSMFVLIIILAVSTLTRPGAGEGIAFMLKPDMSHVEEAGGLGFVCLKALGACFASLSLGYGQYMIFGSYLKDNDNITKDSILAPAGDTSFALLSGFTIIPLIFISGQTPGSGGSGTLFGTLPLGFAALGGIGRIFSLLFWLVAIFAAITSLTPVVEVCAAWLNESFHIERRKGAVICSILMMITNSLCVLGYSVLAGVQPFGMNLFNFVGTIVDFMIPLSALSIAVFTGWVWTPEKAKEEITRDGSTFALYPVWRILIRYVAPVCILAVFIMTVF